MKNYENRPDMPGDATLLDDESAETTALVGRVGPRLVQYLFSASKTVQLHDIGNRAAQRVLTDLMGVVREIEASEDHVSVKVTSDFVLINGVRLNVDTQHMGPLLYLIEEMQERDVAEFEILPGMKPEEMGRFLQVFFGETPSDEPFAKVEQSLAAAHIEHIKLTEWVEQERQLRAHDADTKQNIRGESNQAFFRTVVLVDQVLKGIEKKRVIQVRKAERLTQQMVDIIQTDESILLGLTSIKNFDEYTFRHSVNVCVLSMFIADRLGLYKTDIARLGVCALLHDIGKTYIPQSILNKPGMLSDTDWELMKYHTFFGVQELSRVKSLREVTDAMFVALQHHVHYDDNGYPQRPDGWSLSLFSRIVTVADYFDAMTTPRVYKKTPLTPDRALMFILCKSGKIFDPLIAKVFVQAMGIYPIGSVVDLSSGETGVVVRQNPNVTFLHRPFVALLGPDGSLIDETDPVDLTERADSEDGFLRSIARAVYDVSVEQQKSTLFMQK